MSRMITNAVATCPYCGFKQNATVPESVTEFNVIYCDSEAGGCDQPFAYTVVVMTSTSVYKLAKFPKGE